MLCERLTVVLHQVQSPDNLGAVARVMANFGFSALCLSNPPGFSLSEAEKLAVKSIHILEGARSHASLPEALGDCVYACGTTSRSPLEGRPLLSPEAAAAKLAEQAQRGRVALVFGGERRGLSDAELDYCQDVLAIPTEAVQPSMNLAQSAAVLLYLCARQQRSTQTLSVAPGATLGLLNAIQARMGELLSKAGFLNPQAPDYVRVELWQTLARANLSQREAELWVSALKHLCRTVEAGVLNPKGRA